MNTIAPTGTTSLSVGQNCSSGIEPIFALSYNRTIRTGKDDETVTEEVSDFAYNLYRELTGRNEVPDYFVTTLDIDPYDSIDVQAAFQKYIDHSKDMISLIENLPEGEQAEMHNIESLLRNLTFPTTSFDTVGEEVSNITDDEYRYMVTKGKEHCFRGDVFQIVLSRQFSQKFKGDDFIFRITSYNVCYTKLLRRRIHHFHPGSAFRSYETGVAHSET